MQTPIYGSLCTYVRLYEKTRDNEVVYAAGEQKCGIETALAQKR